MVEIIEKLSLKTAYYPCQLVMIQNQSEYGQGSLVVDLGQSSSERGLFRKRNLMTILIVISLVVLTITICRQHQLIKNISAAVTAHQQKKANSYQSYQLFVNHSLQTSQLSFNIIDKQILEIEQRLRLELLKEIARLEKRCNQLETIIIENDQAVRNLQRNSLEQEFVSRKKEMEQAIEGINQSTFEGNYNHTINGLRLSLNNIDCPLTNYQQRRNHMQLMKQLLQQEYISYRVKYGTQTYPHELSMCVVVSTRNNAKYNRYLYNIKSLLNQNYTNYRVIILDDASEDKTALLLKRFLRQNRIGEDKVLVIQRTTRMGSLANIDYAVKSFCQNMTITFPIDGDDELIGNNVFKLFNAIYQSKNPGIAYSNHIYYMQDSKSILKGYSEEYSPLSKQKRNYRKIPQMFGHLRSFRTDLFLRIKQQDLRDKLGRYFMVSGDEAFLFPILEMACGNIEYIDEVTYLYNAGTGNNVKTLYHEEQESNAIYIRLLPKYDCLPRYQQELL